MIDMTIAGSSVSTVIRTMICIGVPRFFCRIGMKFTLPPAFRTYRFRPVPVQKSAP